MLICGFVEKMKIARMCLLRMAVTMLGLLLSVLLLAFPASGLVIQSKVCEDQFAHVNLNGQELFYVNEDSVEEALFCDAIRAYYANGCTSESYIGCIYCGSVLPPVYIPFKTGRKLMQKELTNGFTFHHGKDKDTSDSKSMTKKVAIAAGGAFLVCCVFLFPCFYKRRKESAPNVIAKESSSMHNSASSFGKNHAVEKIPGSPLRVPPSPRYSNSPKLSRLGSVHLNLSQIMRATQNFSKSQLIGEGGFGSIYKARLADGQVVSIKRAKKELFENLQTEFSSEVELLAKIDHRNLVKLLGYVDEGNERLIITEYVVNGNLREHLDGLLGKTLEFNQRLEIAIDVAHALTYLHLYAEKPIIHRDVKSSNILLTESMRAKVAEFGFARLGPMGDDTDRTHISTKVKGTVGYLDPEYMKTYQLTAKSDVYSFGVVLIEIMTGRRPVELKKPAEERVTLRWAFKLLNEGRMMELIDPAIEETVDAEVLMKIFDLAIQCAAPVRADRPDMKTVGEQLWTIRADYIKSLKSVVVSQSDISI